MLLLSKVFGSVGFLVAGGKLHIGIGERSAVRARVDLSSPRSLGVHWVPPDLHGFCELVFDTLKLLNDFVRQVWWCAETLGCHVGLVGCGRVCLLGLPAWLRPDFVPPSPFRVVKVEVAKTSHISVQLHLIDAEFRKAWMLFFCRSVHPVVTVGQFLAVVDPCLPQEAKIDLPRVTGQNLLEVARANRSMAGGLDGWNWNEIKALHLAWFSGLAILLNMVEIMCDWPQGLLDAYIAMIPRPMGILPPGSGPCSVLPLVSRLWTSLRLSHLKDWVQGWVLSLYFVWGMVRLRLRRGSPLRLILRRSCLGLGVISCMLWLLMLSSPLTLLIGVFWIVPWVVLVSLPGSGKYTSPIIVRFG